MQRFLTDDFTRIQASFHVPTETKTASLSDVTTRAYTGHTCNGRQNTIRLSVAQHLSIQKQGLETADYAGFTPIGVKQELNTVSDDDADAVDPHFAA